MDMFPLGQDLGSLALLSLAKTRSINAENPTGSESGGARSIPGPESEARQLGKGWKVRPCIPLPSNSLTTLAEVAGPGIIQHLWFTISDQRGFRHCILRFYWDGEPSPSIEVPLGDFFANGHAIPYSVNSLPVVVNPTKGLNCYWPMPFRSSCRITVENQGWYDVRWFFYQITYALCEIPDAAAYFHATWRRTPSTEPRAPQHVILEGVKGRGHYVGTFLAWARRCSNEAWTEGEVKFFIDNDTDDPTICSTGTEDYLGAAWGLNEIYCTPFLGHPLSHNQPGSIPKHAMYRWHVMDPIRFDKGIKATIQTLGWTAEPGREGIFVPLSDDVASVAYWYQTEPHASFPDLPGVPAREPL